MLKDGFSQPRQNPVEYIYKDITISILYVTQVSFNVIALNDIKSQNFFFVLVLLVVNIKPSISLYPKSLQIDNTQ